MPMKHESFLYSEHLQLKNKHLRVYMILYKGKTNFALATRLLYLSDF